MQAWATGREHAPDVPLGTYCDDENELEGETRPDDLKDVNPPAAEILCDCVRRDDQRESDECGGNRQ
jgi:hypothetical protein